MKFILTYNQPHQKTQDLIFALLANGIKDISIVATPWVTRKNFQAGFTHRPNFPIELPIEQLCKNLNLPFYCCEKSDLDEFFESKKAELILIGGAGILKGDFLTNNKVINAHPGYLPFVKGLDALKWAILKNLPLGQSAHLISDEVDAGLLITQSKLPLFKEDQFFELAMRQYKMEISLMVESIGILQKKGRLKPLHSPEIIPFRRLPTQLEADMFQQFRERCKGAPSKYSE